MNLKVYAILGAIILGLSGGLYLSLSAAFTARSELKATNALLEEAKRSNQSLEAFTESLQRQVVKANLDASKSRQGIEHVLQNTEWSNDITPEPIADELCKYLNCESSETR